MNSRAIGDRQVATGTAGLSGTDRWLHEQQGYRGQTGGYRNSRAIGDRQVATGTAGLSGTDRWLQEEQGYRGQTGCYMNSRAIGDRQVAGCRSLTDCRAVSPTSGTGKETA
ncbi:hypothetical protein ACOMHN_003726 [Nucella lapillus]